jgi:hypothetical protein
MPTPMSMSKLPRAVVLVAMLAAIHLAGLVAVAQAHTSIDPANARYRALGRVEFPATGDHAVAFQEQPTADAQQVFRRGERASLDQPTAGTVAAVATPVRPAEPSHQPGLLPASLGVLAAVLALVAVVVARRAHRSQRASQTA